MSPPKAKQAIAVHQEGSDDEAEDGTAAQGKKEKGAVGGTLKPMLQLDSGVAVTITIDRIKLKDPQEYIEPFFTVSVKGPPMRNGMQ